MATQTLPVFRGHLLIRGKIECKTGIHIGGSNEKMQIGGVDLVVIRNPANQHPYLPGSSIKGKLRHLLEYITGGVNHPFQGQLGNVSVHPDIVRLFGIGAEVTLMAEDDKEYKKELDKAKGNEDKVKYIEYVRDQLKGIGLARLTVRDAHPDEQTITMWENLGSDANFTEYKAENTIDRLTSAANPRFLERVVAGSKFDFELVYTAYGSETETSDEIGRINQDVSNLLAAMRLLENDSLGKSGTRGYGRIQFHLAEPMWIMAEDYLAGSENFTKSRAAIPDEGLSPIAGMSSTFHYPKNPAANV